MTHNDAAPRDSVRRFDLAVQKSHLAVYAAALVTALLGAALGVFEIRYVSAILAWAFACACAIAFHELYKRGVDRRILNPLWLTVDAGFVTLGVYVTGGIRSPWFIWY